MSYRVRIFLREATQYEGSYIGEQILPFAPKPLAEILFSHQGRQQRAVIERIAPQDWVPSSESIPALHVVAVAATA